MRRALLDADAFNGLRGLGLLEKLCDSPSRPGPLVLTEFVARHELSDVFDKIEKLAAQGSISIEPVAVRSDAGKRWRELKAARMDKGEAESLAWALGFDGADMPVFVTRDTRAMRAASDRKVPSADPFGLIVAAVEARWIARADAKVALSVWDDRRMEICRPRDWDSFDVNYSRRLNSVAATFLIDVSS